MNDSLIEQLKNGTCPFTGQRYDCARCTTKPEMHYFHKDTDEPGQRHCHIHMSLCITGYVSRMSRREFGKLARSMRMDDGRIPTPEQVMAYFMELHSFGVSQIPISNECKNFCFKYGCMGENE